VVLVVLVLVVAAGVLLISEMDELGVDSVVGEAFVISDIVGGDGLVSRVVLPNGGFAAISVVAELVVLTVLESLVEDTGWMTDKVVLLVFSALGGSLDVDAELKPALLMVTMGGLDEGVLIAVEIVPEALGF